MNTVLNNEENATLNDIFCYCEQTISEEIFKEADPELYQRVKNKVPQDINTTNEKCCFCNTEIGFFLHPPCKKWLCKNCLVK